MKPKYPDKIALIRAVRVETGCSLVVAIKSMTSAKWDFATALSHARVLHEIEIKQLIEDRMIHRKEIC